MIMSIKRVKMKAYKLLSTLAIVLSAISLSVAQSSFEGVITYKTTNASNKEEATVKWYHKKGNNLMEFDAKAGDYQMKYSMIMGSNDETVFMKSDMGSQEISGIEAEEVFKLAKYVRKMNVNEAGYECEMLMFKSQGNDLTYWVTNDIGINYSDLPKLMRNNMPSLSGISTGVPVKMELRDADGNLLKSQDVISVDKQSVADSKFAK